MRQIKILCAMLAVLGLTAACGSTKFVGQPPVLNPPPPALEAECADTVPLPHRQLKQREVERLWGQDRANLVECGEGKAALRDFYRDRDARLSMKAP